MEHREQFEELSFLLAWGAELCLAIVGPSQVRSHQLARMQATSLAGLTTLYQPTMAHVAHAPTLLFPLAR
jgi:hypothetical protein